MRCSVCAISKNRRSLPIVYVPKTNSVRGLNNSACAGSGATSGALLIDSQNRAREGATEGVERLRLRLQIKAAQIKLAHLNSL